MPTYQQYKPSLASLDTRVTVVEGSVEILKDGIKLTSIDLKEMNKHLTSIELRFAAISATMALIGAGIGTLVTQVILSLVNIPH